MKTLIFITLKIFETTGAILAYCGLCVFGKWALSFMTNYSDYIPKVWCSFYYFFYGLIIIICIIINFGMLASIIWYFIPKWIEWNKNNTDKIYRKIQPGKVDNYEIYN